MLMVIGSFKYCQVIPNFSSLLMLVLSCSDQVTKLHRKSTSNAKQDKSSKSPNMHITERIHAIPSSGNSLNMFASFFMFLSLSCCLSIVRSNLTWHHRPSPLTHMPLCRKSGRAFVPLRRFCFPVRSFIFFFRAFGIGHARLWHSLF